jgi:hypothetical protein
LNKGEADVWIWFSPTKPIDNYILDFFVTNWCLGLKSMVILMNFWSLWIGWSEGKTDERIGFVLRFSDEQVLKDMEMWLALSFIFWWKHTQPLKRELEV